MVDAPPEETKGQFTEVMLTLGALLFLLVLAHVFWPAYLLIVLAVFLYLRRPRNRARISELIEDTLGLEEENVLEPTHLGRLFWPAVLGIVTLRLVFAVVPEAAFLLGVGLLHYIFIKVQGKLQMPIALDFILFGTVWIAMKQSLFGAVCFAVVADGIIIILFSSGIDQHLPAMVFHVITAFAVVWLAGVFSPLVAAIWGMLLTVTFIAILPMLLLCVGSLRTLFAFVVKVLFAIALLFLTT